MRDEEPEWLKKEIRRLKRGERVYEMWLWFVSAALALAWGAFLAYREWKIWSD